MSFPADIPNPNQENVFYSIPAIKNELLNYFTQEKTQAILEKLESFYLPVFVFDDDGAPDNFSLDVYPKGLSKQNFAMDSFGNIISSVQPKQASVSPPSEDSITDGGFQCILNASFYSHAKLKSPLDIDVGTIEDVVSSMDLLISTKLWKDESLMNERAQNFSILKNLLLGKLKSLPDEELEAIKDNYESFVQKIADFRNVLQSIKEGQQTSIDGLFYSNYYQDLYQDTASLRDSERAGLAGTKMLLAQALSDLGNPISQTDGRLRKGTWRNGNKYPGYDEVSRIVPGSYSSRTSSDHMQIWPDFVNKLIELERINEPEIDVPSSGLYTTLDSADLNSIFLIGSKDVFSSEGKPKEWYYDNFEKVVTGKEPDFSELENYLDTFRDVTEKYKKKSSLYSLGGVNLLVDQAIKKAIVKLCLSNLEVTDYAPRTTDGTNFFSKIMRTGTLGPSGTTPYPSKYILGDDDFKPNAYTNTAFLCYHSLLQIIDSANKSSSKDFLLGNLTTFDSDHDEVIDLFDDMHSGGLDTSLSQAGVGTGSSARYRTVRECIHAYKINEAFDPAFPKRYGNRSIAQASTTQKIILLGTGDGVPPSERSFAQWYLRRLSHDDESAEDLSEFWTLAKDEPSAVTSEGFLDAFNIPQVYKDMGFRGAVPVLIGGTSVEPEYKRTSVVNYGIGPANSRQNPKNVIEFYKQKRYSMPYFWCCMVSLWRALTVETWRELLVSINDIVDVEVEMTTEEILESFNHEDLWKRIRALTSELKEESDMKFSIYVSIDGTLNFVEKNAIGGRVANSFEYRNTPGLNSKKMMQAWVNFVSTVSNHSSIQLVDDYNMVDFDESLYLPPEGIAKNTNANFSNNHGGSSQYIQPVWKQYNDKLEYKMQEFELGLPVGKSTSAIGTPMVNENNKAQGYIDITKTLHKHGQLFEHVVKAFNGIQSFIQGFQVPETVSDVFNSGFIDTRKELQDPAGLIRQIEENQNLYSANEFGLGKRWLWSFDVKDFMNRSEDWLYINVLGIKKEAWFRYGKTNSRGQVYLEIIPEYVGVDSSVPVSGAVHKVYLQWVPYDYHYRRSQQILQYLHLVRGLDLYDGTFSENNKLVYSDLLIDSESGVFPWTADDFEEGEPKKNLETLYSMSPWLFPENYFYEVCTQNQYHRVFGCVITKQNLSDAGVGVEVIEGNIEDIIGSIRWVVRR